MIELDVVRGDTVTLAFTITKAYDANGNPLGSLGGLAWKLQAKLSPNDATPVFTKSTSNGTITVQGFTVKVHLNEADTANLAGKRLWCDLQATDSQNRNVTVFLQGSPYIILNILRDITQ